MHVIILGLGPGDPNLLTVEARAVLDDATEVWLRTAHHPTVSGLGPHLAVHSFDDLYESAEEFGRLYATIVESVLALAKRTEGVVYAVPGSPMVAEATVPAIREQAQAAGIPVRMVPGLSFLEPVAELIGVDPVASHVQLADALEPNVDPARPALFAQLYSRRIAGQLKATLGERYPDDHPVRLVRAAGTRDAAVLDLRLFEIDRSDFADHLTTLFVPALSWEQNLASYDTFEWIVGRLRRECPWDRKQTHESLKEYLLEETYETLEALDEGDPAKLSEELGDLMLQVVLHAEIARGHDEFDMRTVLSAIGAKLVRRHPHVFGDVSVSGAEEVVANWEQLKRRERPEGTSALSGVPVALPALSLAQKIQSRAKRAGFDCVSAGGALDKVVEEAHELANATTDEARRDELGDLLFSLVGVARHLDVDAEEALRLAARRFRARFEAMERLAGGRSLSLLSRTELRSLWERAKGEEGQAR